MFLATDLTHGEADPEPTEALEVRWVALTEAVAMVRDGRITDAMSVAGILHVALERAAALTELHVLRVFIGPDGRGGNPLGVFVDARPSRPDASGSSRPGSASAGRSSSMPSTVAATTATAGRHGRRAHLHPAAELPFAGHPTVGTAWRRRARPPVDVLRCPPAMCGRGPGADGRRWIRARSDWVHDFTIDQRVRRRGRPRPSARRWATRPLRLGVGGRASRAAAQPLLRHGLRDLGGRGDGRGTERMEHRLGRDW